MTTLMIQTGTETRVATAAEVAEAHGRFVIEAMNRELPVLESPATTRRYLVDLLAGRDYESYVVLFLNNRHGLIEAVELFRGTIDGASVHPREVVKAALWKGAAAVIFAHNHPSGIAEPSQADELITLRLRDALALIEVRVLDHIIVGLNRCTSLAERGLI
jgi:DNA repair protein RadC